MSPLLSNVCYCIVVPMFVVPVFVVLLFVTALFVVPMFVTAWFVVLLNNSLLAQTQKLPK